MKTKTHSNGADITKHINSGRNVNYDSRCSSLDGVGDWSLCFDRFQGSEEFKADFNAKFKRFCEKRGMSCGGLRDTITNKHKFEKSKPADVSFGAAVGNFAPHPDEVLHDFEDDYTPTTVSPFDPFIDQIAA